jgi:hypothetical protein
MFAPTVFHIRDAGDRQAHTLCGSDPTEWDVKHYEHARPWLRLGGWPMTPCPECLKTRGELFTLPAGPVGGLDR